MDKSEAAQDAIPETEQKTSKAKSRLGSERKSVLDFRKYTKQRI